jgi:phosphomannomutase
MNDDLRQRARDWIDGDPDAETRAAGEALLASGDAAAIAEAFGAHLEFGTAGLRGELGPGPNRMNRAVVRRTTAGLAAYLERHAPDARERGVVIGYDGRHGSREFARDAARVLAHRGFAAWIFPHVVPTPVLAYAVRNLGTSAGIMVTASHNPPRDNGYKVYWGNGAQIIPPHDVGIAAAIAGIGPARAIPLAPDDHPAIQVAPARLLTEYEDAVLALRVHHDTGVRVVYTPMHGVGRDVARAVLHRAGHTDLHVVPQQAEPDPDFPTVRFPNPEEPGALDLALALAREVGADLLVANDPDADRLAVAVPDGRGGWRALDGNQIGVLIAEDLLAHGPQGAERLVATTIVSSRLLSRIAAAHGVHYGETLTGFKWIANLGLAEEARGRRFVMGYEEALGSTSGGVVRDKDGISAALLFCDLAAWCKARGETVLDRLAALHRRHGLHLTRQRSVTLRGAEGADRIRGIIARLRADPPRDVAGVGVATVGDYQTGAALDLATGARTPIDLPRSDVLAFDLADGGRILARPSGTEPKIKFYFEVREPIAEGEALESAEARARAALDRLEAAFVDRALGK